MSICFFLFPRIGFQSGNFFLIAPFSVHCLLVPLHDYACLFFLSLQDPELPFLVYDIGADLCIKCLESQAVELLLCESRTKKCGAVVKAARSHSDLIPNVYEGTLHVHVQKRVHAICRDFYGCKRLKIFRLFHIGCWYTFVFLYVY